MRINFCIPFNPKKRVKDMLVSSLLADSILIELQQLGIRPLKAGRTNGINSEIAYHPDILTFNYVPGKWLAENESFYLPEYMNDMLTRINTDLSEKYPCDCIFNSFACGDIVFCGQASMELYRKTEIFNGFRYVILKQGYSKCSVIFVDDRSFITSDKSIEKKLNELHYDCLYVTDKDIRLNGFSNGFIGGCAAKADKSTLLFTGDIKKHSDYQKIKSFCGNHGVFIHSLSNECLYDYGGLLPITEQD